MGPRRSGLRTKRKEDPVAAKEKCVASMVSCEGEISLIPWDMTFDLSMLPFAVTQQCLEVAPVLMGRNNARYDATFFNRVLNLCTDGYLMLQLTDAVVPKTILEENWPDKDGRHYFLDYLDDDLRVAAQKMYIQVYGGPPDNGGVSATFLRGIVVSRRNPKKSVHWAEWAAKIWSDRKKNADRNPLKLSPPTLRIQIQALIQVLGKYATISNGSLSGAPPSTKRTHLLPLTSEGVQAPQTWPLQKSQPDKLALTDLEEAKLQRDDVEKHLFHLEHKGEGLEGVLVGYKQSLAQLEDKCYKVVEEHSFLRSQAKCMGAAGILVLKRDFENKARQKNNKLQEVDTKIEKALEYVTEIEGQVKALEDCRRALRSKVGDLTASIEVLILESSCVKPQRVFTKLPCVPLKQMVKLRSDEPCPLCGLYFVDSASVPLNCRCFFHPHCIWNLVLSKGCCRMECPQCQVYKSGKWMAQWGFNICGKMVKGVNAAIAQMEANGWLDPLRISASHTSQFRIAKRACLVKDLDAIPNKHQKITEDGKIKEHDVNVAVHMASTLDAEVAINKTVDVDSTPVVTSKPKSVVDNVDSTAITRSTDILPPTSSTSSHGPGLDACNQATIDVVIDSIVHN